MKKEIVKEVAKKSYIGTVISEFRIRGKVKRVGTKYNCKNEFSFNELKKQNKIK